VPGLGKTIQTEEKEMAEYYEDDRPAGGDSGSFSVGAEKKKLAEYKATLEELTEIVNSMKEGGFTRKKGTIEDPARLRELVSSLNDNLPEAVDRAHNVLDNAMTIVNSANKMKKSLDEQSAKLDADIQKRKEDCDRTCSDAIEAANAQGKKEADRIVTEAEDQAAVIVETAKKRAAALVEEHAITAQAKEEAALYMKTVKDDADNYSANVRADADAYADAVRKKVENDQEKAYQKLREVVNTNLQMIETVYTKMENDIKASYKTVSSDHSMFLEKYANKK